MTAAESAPDAANVRFWVRFLAPYYVCNTVALLLYLPIRYQGASDALLERENFLNLPLEQEIFLLALGSWLINYRKKATIDGVISLFFMYGKLGVLAALYYLDMTVFGWYAAFCLVLFAAVGQPKYDGPSRFTELNPALVEKLVKSKASGPRKGPKTPNSWLVFYYADWSDYCLEHEPMLAELSLRYSSDALQFGKVDVNKWSDLAVENRIDVSTSSSQLPTLILFQDGQETMRLPPIDADGKVTKTILDRAGLLAVFKLQDLKDGKPAALKPKSS
ncbi:Thioredoxin- transmembrane protein 2 [Phytophthora boehmeriae]|uniref:Thioredoxin- transmembrane protein 2 n=1 Tax=Phytophthora boehmeriae TaxID=109152 RepID=A0A8T1WIU9_9STRA|nr:Thioredoxin- transmembrane protein 2 [Phytophthora boehmeriae]